MDRVLEDAFIMPGREQGGTEAGAALNVYEEGDGLVVEAQMLGVKPEDIDVSVDGGTLTVRGEVKRDDERKDRNYLVREHARQTFVRSMRLPDTVDPDGAQASYEAGILRLRFPKSERARSRRIEVTSGGQRAIPGTAQSGERPALGIGRRGPGGLRRRRPARVGQLGQQDPTARTSGQFGDDGTLGPGASHPRGLRSAVAAEAR